MQGGDNTLISNNLLFDSKGLLLKSGGSHCKITHNISSGSESNGLNIYTGEEVYNNIIINNQGYGIVGYFYNTNLDKVNNNNFFNNLLGPSDQEIPNNNIFDDPLIVSPNFSDPIQGNWHLNSGSPCIGTGVNGINIGLSDPDNIGPK